VSVLLLAVALTVWEFMLAHKKVGKKKKKRIIPCLLTLGFWVMLSETSISLWGLTFDLRFLGNVILYNNFVCVGVLLWRCVVCRCLR
jgi:hypothetical protein